MPDPKPEQSSDRTDAPETVEVEETTVYLSLGDNGTVDCPYCDRRFVLKPGAATAGH